jgi:hypothetical protein
VENALSEAIAASGAAFNVKTPPVLDAALHRVIDAWPTLPLNVRNEILVAIDRK